MNQPDPRRPRRLAGASGHSLAFGGLVLFTFLLYVRPNDLLPIGTFPIVKIMTIGALAGFFLERLGRGERISVMPQAFKYLLTLAGLTVVSIPLGLDPAASFAGFTDLFLKILLVFLLMINVVTSFYRLRVIMSVTVISATVVAALTLFDYARGKNLVEGYRAAGALGGIFGNPNDLALAMNVLLPIAVGLALGRRRASSKLLYVGCAVLMTGASVVTYSRAGLLTMAIAGGFFILKLSRRYPVVGVVGAVVGAGVVFSSPGRLFTLFEATDGSLSAAESASMRWELVTRSLEVMGGNPLRWLFGVGMDNFHIVSHKELVNHNAFLQVFNEVGLPALIFYILFLVSAIRITSRIARRYRTERGFRQVWLLAIAIHTSIVAYIVGSSFASVAFLWYVYYPVGFAVCLDQLLTQAERAPAQSEGPSRVWYLRRAQY